MAKPEVTSIRYNGEEIGTRVGDRISFTESVRDNILAAGKEMGLPKETVSRLGRVCVVDPASAYEFLDLKGQCSVPADGKEFMHASITNLYEGEEVSMNPRSAPVNLDVMSRLIPKNAAVISSEDMPREDAPTRPAIDGVDQNFQNGPNGPTLA